LVSAEVVRSPADEALADAGELAAEERGEAALRVARAARFAFMATFAAFWCCALSAFFGCLLTGCFACFLTGCVALAEGAAEGVDASLRATAAGVAGACEGDVAAECLLGAGCGCGCGCGWGAGFGLGAGATGLVLGGVRALLDCQRHAMNPPFATLRVSMPELA
jgi:hypothetical protein